MKRIIAAIVLCTIAFGASFAQSFRYKYLYTIDSDGMKTVNKMCENIFNRTNDPYLVYFSSDYSVVTFGKAQGPDTWRLAYTTTRNNTFYYTTLRVPGIVPGRPFSMHESTMAGKASSGLKLLQIFCGQPDADVQFHTYNYSSGLPVMVGAIPKSPITVLVKSDFSKINIYFHKSGDTVVLEKGAPEAKKETIPDLIE